MYGSLGTSHRPPTVAVIGASGFIGLALVKVLAQSGALVYTFTRQQPFLRNGRLDASILRSDVIFYLASRISPAVAERDPALVAKDDVDFRAFVYGLREAHHRPVVVLASSGGTAYDPDVLPPYVETTATRAESAYGLAKLAQEAELGASVRWISPVTLRLGNVYGPGQRAGAGYGVISYWIAAILAGDPIWMLGDSGTRRDYVHVTDVVAAMLAVIRQTSSLQASGVPVVLNVASGVPTTLREVHRGLEEVIGRRIPVKHAEARGFDRRDVWLDVRRAQAVLGWQPAIQFMEGLKDTWRYEIGRLPAVAPASTTQVRR